MLYDWNTRQPTYACTGSSLIFKERLDILVHINKHYMDI